MSEPRRPKDPYGALTADDVCVAGQPGGPLSGLTFVVKDLYDVAGYATVAGSPAWAAAHGAAAQTAPAVGALLEAGADLVGKSQTDELAWSLLGQNAHFGTPTNPRCPDRVPGGSSSGSVVAVAGGMVEFALGSDTGGSVRVPASNCGVYGIRTTQGAIPLDHVVPLAPSFDTVGWFARDAGTMEQVGAALLDGGAPAARPGRALIAADAFALADASVRQLLEPAAASVAESLGESDTVTLSQDGLDGRASAWRTIQAREVWQVHGAWVTHEEPSFGPGIRERFEWARTVGEDEETRARAVQEAAVGEIGRLLNDETVVLAPAVPSIAPRLDESPEQLELYRTRAMQLTCTAGLCGLPQLTVPAGEVEGCPVGLGIIGPAGGDRTLLDLAVRLARAAG